MQIPKNLLVCIVFLSLFLFPSCARPQNNPDDTSLPKRCGEYYVFYGIPEGYKKDDGTISAPITLNGENLSYLDSKYVGKKVAVFSWIQVVGGLLNADGSGGESTVYYNPVKVLPLYGENRLLNSDAIIDQCRQLKKKR